MNDALKEAIEREMSRYSLTELSKAREELTRRYRDPARHGKKALFMTSDLHRIAYLATRLPATHAVVKKVLEELKQRHPQLVVKSVLDLGAGPGTATWAALEVFPEIERATLVEHDSDLIAIGKRLASSQSEIALKWLPRNIAENDPFEQHDLVVVSYALGELDSEAQALTSERAWDASLGALALIEPGSMAGFAGIRKVRETLISKRASIVAPCPHAHACPMPSDDWCHFSERIARTSEHRKLKEGALGYEDEKYSYLLFTQSPFTSPSSRILSPPEKHSGHLKLRLCTPQGIKSETLARSDGALYKMAKKLEWGDLFPNSDS